MKIKRHEMSYNELSEIIVDAIMEESYLNKDELKNKIRSILSGFQLSLKVYNYNKYFNETKNENALMKLERVELEYSYFKLHLKAVLNEDDYIRIMNSVNEFNKNIKTNEPKNN